MNDFVLRAAPMSWTRIAALTGDLRQALGLVDVKKFPIIEILERVIDQKLDLVRVEVEDEAVMGDMEAFADPAGQFIRFSERVYREAYQGKPRARWTVAHETGHFFLHARKPLARVTGKAAIEALRPFECPERQAHQFAAELLMPRGLIRSTMSVEEICRDFGVSEEAATKRLRFVKSLVRK
jgi:Zn-dependent peptidase ImmA (M78 family)